MNSPEKNLENLIEVSIIKSKLSLKKLFFRGVLAGLYIGLGAMFFLKITSFEPTHPFNSLIGGLCFSLGLILVSIAGAELFTGNNLMSASLYSRKICPFSMLRNWSVVYLGNLIGSLILVFIFIYSGLVEDDLAKRIINVGANKLGSYWHEAFLKAILCNILVCLAVWMALSAKSVSSKVLVIIFPITAFVAMGHEHSVANMFFLPAAFLVELKGMSPILIDQIFLIDIFKNLFWVTIGNVFGGSVILAGLIFCSFKHK